MPDTNFGYKPKRMRFFASSVFSPITRFAWESITLYAQLKYAGPGNCQMLSSGVHGVRRIQFSYSCCSEIATRVALIVTPSAMNGKKAPLRKIRLLPPATLLKQNRVLPKVPLIELIGCRRYVDSIWKLVSGVKSKSKELAADRYVYGRRQFALDTIQATQKFPNRGKEIADTSTIIPKSNKCYYGCTLQD